MDKACYDAIGRRIRYVRYGKKLTQEQVAERAENFSKLFEQD